MSKTQYTLTSENISSNGGFSLVSRLLAFNRSFSQWDNLRPGGPQQCHSNQAVVRCLTLMMCAGCSNYSDVEKFRNDCLFKSAVGAPIPSEATLRQRLESISSGQWQKVVDACVAEQLAKVTLTPVEVMSGSSPLIPVDIDVSVLKDIYSAKEGIAMTYHRVNGYAPIFAYAGREGYQVAAELRHGSQHCENGAVNFLKRTVAILAAAGHTPETLLIRVDSGHDAAEFIQACRECKVHYIVKHNLRKESPEQLLDSIRFYDQPEFCRPGKTIYRGIRSDLQPDGMEESNVFLAVEAIERTILSNGQHLLLPQVDLDSWWTDLPCTVQQCVKLYHDHGTSEQFHSELKSDLGIELLPSGKFRANALFLGIATLAFNCMRRIGQLALEVTEFPADVQRPLRLRLRTVLLDFIKVGCKLVRHAGRQLLKFGNICFNFSIIKEVYAKC